MHKLAGPVILVGMFVLVLLGSSTDSRAQQAADRPAGGTATPPPSATPIPWIDFSCPSCPALGIGNPTPVAVGNGSGPGNCPNCLLTNEKFWLSINSPGSSNANGEPYNTKYINSLLGFSCVNNQFNTATPNPAYVPAPNMNAGYNYAIQVDPAQGDLSLYAYDPAQYFRDGVGGTSFDTYDTQACTAGSPTLYRFRTFFQLYQPDSTPTDFSDDVPLGAPISFQDDGTTTYHDKWFSLGTLPAALAATGRFRLQVYTDDLNASGTYGIGANQYALALGGPRQPTNTESISSLGPVSSVTTFAW